MEKSRPLMLRLKWLVQIFYHKQWEQKAEYVTNDVNKNKI